MSFACSRLAGMLALRFLWVWGLGLAGLPLVAAEPQPWLVDNAVVRVQVRVTRQPSHPGAGCIVQLPDGGLLPTPAPSITIYDEKKGQLSNGCLWHDSGRGFALVMASPAGKDAWVYCGSASKVKPWAPDSGLTPSVIAYIKPDAKGMPDAARVARESPPGEGVIFTQLTGMEIGAVPQGLNGPFADYISGYLLTRDPGQTWLAFEPSNGGGIDVLIGGRKVRATKRFPQLSGSTGAWVMFTNTPQRVEMFTHRPSEHARLRLAWKTPHAEHKELGGDNPQHEGLSMWAARPIFGHECLSSGAAEIVRIERRDHAPVATFSAEPKDYMWLQAEVPMIRYELHARTEDNPEGTIYDWDFGDGRRVAGQAQITWLFEGKQPHAVTLTAVSGGRSSSCALAVEGYCSGNLRASANHPPHRDLYREVLLKQLGAALPEESPTAAWGGAAWDLCISLVDPAEGETLITALVGKNWEKTAAELPEDKRWRLEDLYYGMRAPDEPDEVARVITRIERYEQNRDRLALWQIRRVELLMYYLDDLPRAKKLAQLIASSESSQAARARVRMADMAFLQGDVDTASRIYGSVQSKVTYGISEGDKIRRHRKAANDSGDPRRIADWRIAAVRSTGVSETTRNLLRQKAYTEARRHLDEWELEFPLTKLTDDFIVVEASFLMATGDFLRPRLTLAAYCKAVDVTNSLAEAVRMALRCMFATDVTRAEIDAFVEQTKTRFKYHPLGGEVDAILKTLETEYAGKAK